MARIIYVSSGVTSSGLTLGSGVTLAVLSGGIAEGVLVRNGGDEQVSSGATDSGSTIFGGGAQEVFGRASAVTLRGGQAISGMTLGASETVEAGGSVVGATIGTHGAQTVLAGGVVRDLIVSSGGLSDVASGGRVSDATISAGGGQYVYAGATETGLSILGGETVDYGGVAHAQVAEAGSRQYGLLALVGAGSAVNVDFSYGGVLETYQSALVTSAVIGSGAYAYISGGTLRNTDVEGEVYLYSGGVASRTTVSDGGALGVNSGASAAGVTVSSGGSLIIWQGSTVRGVQNDGGDIFHGRYVSSGSVVHGATLAGGVAEDVLSGGVTSNVVLSPNSVQEVDAGGVAVGTVLQAATSAGYTLQVVNGGQSFGASLASGALLDESAGVVSGLLLGSGGTFSYYGGQAEDIEAAVGGLIKLAQIRATSVHVDAAGDLVAMNGKTVVATIGLGGDYANERFTVTPEGPDSTIIHVLRAKAPSTQPVSAPSGTGARAASLVAASASFRPESVGHTVGETPLSAEVALGGPLTGHGRSAAGLKRV